jgi:hypothetical protein
MTDDDNEPDERLIAEAEAFMFTGNNPELRATLLKMLGVTDAEFDQAIANWKANKRN